MLAPHRSGVCGHAALVRRDAGLVRTVLRDVSCDGHAHLREDLPRSQLRAHLPRAVGPHTAVSRPGPSSPSGRRPPLPNVEGARLPTVPQHETTPPVITHALTRRPVFWQTPHTHTPLSPHHRFPAPASLSHTHTHTPTPTRIRTHIRARTHTKTPQTHTDETKHTHKIAFCCTAHPVSCVLLRSMARRRVQTSHEQSACIRERISPCAAAPAVGHRLPHGVGGIERDNIRRIAWGEFPTPPLAAAATAVAGECPIVLYGGGGLRV